MKQHTAHKKLSTSMLKTIDIFYSWMG